MRLPVLTIGIAENFETRMAMGIAELFETLIAILHSLSHRYKSLRYVSRYLTSSADRWDVAMTALFSA
jgi:predicted transporter